MTDDSGTFDNGTTVNKAFVDQIYDQIDDQNHSSTNPTVKPKATTDEVVAARGSKASLDARLDVALEEDGTPKAVAGQATETQLSRAEANINLVQNSDLEDWAAGGAAAPDHFTLSGAGAAIARTGPAQADTTDLGTGTYAAKITSGGGAAAKLTQEIISTANYSKYRSVDGRKVGFTIRAKVASSNVLRIVIDDGVTTTVSAYATGSASEQDISAVHEISGSATKLDVYAEVALGANVAYVGGFTVVFSDLAPAAWNPLWAKFRQDILDEAVPTRVKIGGSLTEVDASGTANSQVNAVISSTTGAEDFHSVALPAGLLGANGDRLIVRAGGTLTSDGNNKTFTVVFGGTTLTLYGPAGGNVAVFHIEVIILRLTATTQLMYGRIGFDAAATGNLLFVRAAPGETLANSITLKTRHTHATSGTTTEEWFNVEFHPVHG